MSLEELKQHLLEKAVKVDGPLDTQCWLWPYSKTRGGYGQIKVDGRMVRINRLGYQLFVEPFPNSLWVLHRCDVPACYNPDHLFLGTRRDNIDDMVGKGRHQIGESHWAASLSERLVREIRYLCDEGVLTGVEIGMIYGISDGLVWAIKNKKAWTNVGPPIKPGPHRLIVFRRQQLQSLGLTGQFVRRI